MTTVRAYDVSIVHRNSDSEIHRLHKQAHLTWKKESRNLQQFGLRDGMSILEIGNGPGFVTELLSSIVPNGFLTAIDIDPVLIEYAKQYLPDKARSQYRIVQTSVMKMEFPDNTFDFAVTRLAFQFLSDPISAAKEVLRVLKPGGKLVISDQDGGLGPVTDPVIPEAHFILEQAELAQIALGGDPMIGRRLWRILKTAGFENLDLEAVPYHSGIEGIEGCYPQIDPDRALPLVTKDMISAEELQNFRAAVARFMSAEDPFYLKIILMACGEKL